MFYNDLQFFVLVRRDIEMYAFRAAKAGLSSGG